MFLTERVFEGYGLTETAPVGASFSRTRAAQAPGEHVQPSSRLGAVWQIWRRASPRRNPEPETDQKLPLYDIGCFWRARQHFSKVICITERTARSPTRRLVEDRDVGRSMRRVPSIEAGSHVFRSSAGEMVPHEATNRKSSIFWNIRKDNAPLPSLACRTRPRSSTRPALVPWI